MAYIGKTPLVGNFQICDAISVVNGQAAYTMQVAGVNVIPESSNNIICSLSGVIQKPGSSFTVSGSTITFSQNLVTGDVIDFIQILGSVLDIGTPSDGTVTESKIGSGAVTSSKLSAGKILQVVSVVDDTDTSITSATYTDTGLSANITPISTSSKVLVIVNHAIYLSRSTTSVYGGYKLLRGSTDIFNPNPNDGNGPYGLGYYSGEANGTVLSVMHTTQFLDSPSSTSQQTYKTQGRVYIASSSANIRFNYNAAGNDGKSVMTLMEVAG